VQRRIFARLPSLRALVATGCAAALAGAALFAAPASASPATLRRSLQNIAFAPLDLALSPIVAARSVVRNLSAADDPTAVRVIFAVPGFGWNTGVQAMAATVREIAGLIELLPGLALVFTATDLSPLFDPAETGRALIDVETRAVAVKIGVDYTSIPAAS
jgi:hypothetical protein